jgi:very-short-patch-repair endonuclease
MRKIRPADNPVKGDRRTEATRVRSRALRRDGSDAEATLWRHLRGRQLAGAKFRRQHPIGPYFVDFCCVEARLIVELDGGERCCERIDTARRDSPGLDLLTSGLAGHSPLSPHLFAGRGLG